MKNVFDQSTAEELKTRVESLDRAATPQWGKMGSAQMLAHCAVPYETVYDPQYAVRHPRPNALVRGLLRLAVKRIVVGEKPYKRSSRTAPEFIMSDDKDFDAERARLIGYVEKTQKLGAQHFDGLESHSFGPLTATEWSNLFHKHLDHHLMQFGV